MRRALENHLLSCLRVMLTEAYRLGRIPENPFTVVRPLWTDPRERGVLTVEDVQRLFAEEDIEPAWRGPSPFYFLGLLTRNALRLRPSSDPLKERAERPQQSCYIPDGLCMKVGSVLGTITANNP